ncbi:hypothetical protein [Stutzerimonas stutzeri]|uniref:hypothetical protein n=1 Tax=Stutzerimonas stutzeri TaxID=316 RepID=UPI001C2E3337|nr:hypothetical protein [Stutzerimonas stutzeri]
MSQPAERSKRQRIASCCSHEHGGARPRSVDRAPFEKAHAMESGRCEVLQLRTKRQSSETANGPLYNAARPQNRAFEIVFIATLKGNGAAKSQSDYKTMPLGHRLTRASFATATRRGD